jgi:hypothetical protein
MQIRVDFVQTLPPLEFFRPAAFLVARQHPASFVPVGQHPALADPAVDPVLVQGGGCGRGWGAGNRAPSP